MSVLLIIALAALPGIALAASGTDGTGAAATNVTDGDGYGNIAAGAGSAAGNTGADGDFGAPGGSGGSGNIALGARAGNGGIGSVSLYPPPITFWSGGNGGSNNIAIGGGSAGNGGDAGWSTTGSNGGDNNLAIGLNSSAGNANGASAAGTDGNIAIGSSVKWTTLATGGGSVAIGAGARATAENSVALGASSLANLANTVSVGAAGNEKRIVNVAAGMLSAASTDAVNGSQLYATNQNASAALASIQTAINQLLQSGVCSMSGGTVSCANNVQLAGGSIQAGATNAIAIGGGANVQSSGGIAMGQGATAIQSNSVAIGAGATALSSVAVGTGAQAIGTNTTALGDNAVSSGNFAVALGNNAIASHANSVALGNGSLTSAANTVSVGSAGNERRITNVATPVGDDDAATKGYVDTLIGSSGNDILGSANAYADRRVDALRGEAFRGIAQAAALVPLVPGGSGETTVNVGFASYGGYSAAGIAAAHQIGERLSVNGGIGFGGGRHLIRLGVGMRF